MTTDDENVTYMTISTENKMANDSDEMDLQRDLDEVKQQNEMLRQKIYLTILKAPPNTPPHLIERAAQLLRKIDVTETKQIQAFRDAYLYE